MHTHAYTHSIGVCACKRECLCVCVRASPCIIYKYKFYILYNRRGIYHISAPTIRKVPVAYGTLYQALCIQ